MESDRWRIDIVDRRVPGRSAASRSSALFRIHSGVSMRITVEESALIIVMYDRPLVAEGTTWEGPGTPGTVSP
jgi:hypothetical protein